MSSVSTTIPPALTADQLTVIVASVSCLVFFVVIIMLLGILYRKDPLCCRLRDYQRSQHYTDVPPQYHNSRQSLVGYPYGEHGAAMAQGLGPQLPGRLFIIGKPSSYHLNGPLPRLPSYESVRKKDRQRQIHSMIADRFGLGGSHTDTELPPTYEETLRQSMEISPVDVQSLVTHHTIHVPSQHSTAPEGVTSSHSPAQSICQEPLSIEMS